jgi:hypothetical protein
VSCQQLGEVILTGATASIDFSNIPGTYRDLMLTFEGRTDAVSNNASVFLRFNGDSTFGNYDFVYLQGYGTVVSAAESVGTSYIHSGLLPAANAPAGEVGFGNVRIFDYSRALWNKNLTSQWGLNRQSAGQTIVGTSSGFWRSTAAITQITILPSSNNLVTDTRATLWGLA